MATGDSDTRAEQHGGSNLQTSTSTDDECETEHIEYNGDVTRRSASESRLQVIHLQHDGISERILDMENYLDQPNNIPNLERLVSETYQPDSARVVPNLLMRYHNLQRGLETPSKVSDWWISDDPQSQVQLPVAIEENDIPEAPTHPDDPRLPRQFVGEALLSNVLSINGDQLQMQRQLEEGDDLSRGGPQLEQQALEEFSLSEFWRFIEDIDMRFSPRGISQNENTRILSSTGEVEHTPSDASDIDGVPLQQQRSSTSSLEMGDTISCRCFPVHIESIEPGLFATRKVSLPLPMQQKSSIFELGEKLSEALGLDLDFSRPVSNIKDIRLRTLEKGQAPSIPNSRTDTAISSPPDKSPGIPIHNPLKPIDFQLSPFVGKAAQTNPLYGFLYQQIPGAFTQSSPLQVLPSHIGTISAEEFEKQKQSNSSAEPRSSVFDIIDRSRRDRESRRGVAHGGLRGRGNTSNISSGSAEPSCGSPGRNRRASYSGRGSHPQNRTKVQDPATPPGSRSIASEDQGSQIRSGIPVLPTPPDSGHELQYGSSGNVEGGSNGERKKPRKYPHRRAGLGQNSFRDLSGNWRLRSAGSNAQGQVGDRRRWTPHAQFQPHSSAQGHHTYGAFNVYGQPQSTIQQQYVGQMYPPYPHMAPPPQVITQGGQYLGWYPQYQVPDWPQQQYVGQCIPAYTQGPPHAAVGSEATQGARGNNPNSQAFQQGQAATEEDQKYPCYAPNFEGHTPGGPCYECTPNK